MSLSILGPSHTSADLLALRRLIAELAQQCGLDLTDKSVLRCFLDSDPTLCQAPLADAKTRQELRTMLILLFRLEASSSEDLGVEGLRRLWHQHGETLARFRTRESIPASILR